MASGRKKICDTAKPEGWCAGLLDLRDALRGNDPAPRKVLELEGADRMNAVLYRTSMKQGDPIPLKHCPACGADVSAGWSRAEPAREERAAEVTASGG